MKFPLYLKLTAATTIAMLFFAAGCVHEPVPPGDIDDVVNDTTDTTTNTDTTITDTTSQDVCDPDTVYFENDVLPVLNSSCGISGCHDPATAENGVVLTDYNNIIETGDVDKGDPMDSEIYEKIVETDPDDKMPPPSSGISLSQEQINMIYTWIAQGAKNNGCDPNAGGCNTEDVSFGTDVVPVIDNNCIGCHSGPSPQGGVLLESYTNVKSVVNSGQLEGAITWAAGYTPMPYNQAQLDQCTIDKIKSWIDDGAPNN